ncbi:MAG TPA: energy-coupling factor transporter transmembrane component T, partial [Verrucomicrobiae bacterium]|nr:energy-coupling factor transporter transmembrane component T [Verrucomicrobiae bacterium]
MEIPVWLQENNPAMCPCGCVGKRSRKNFVEKTLYDLAKLIRESVFSEKVARQPGLLQGLDPRAKLLGFACLLLTVSLVHNMLLLALTYFGLAVLAVLSRIPLGMFVKRVWIVVPLFTGIMLLPSLFNWVRPGTTALLLWQFKHAVNFGPFNFPAELAITVQGLKGSGLMILRVGVS